MNKAIGQEQDYRDEFESISRKQNLLDEITEMLGEISDMYSVKGKYRYGKPVQIAFYLKRTIAQQTGITENDTQLNILYDFVKEELEEKKRLGEDDYLKSRGLKSRADQIAEIMAMAGSDPEELKHLASEHTHLGDKLRERLLTRAKEFHLRTILDAASVITQKTDHQLTREQKAHEKLTKELKDLEDRNTELNKRTATSIQRGVAEYKRRKKEAEKLNNVIGKSIRSFAKKQEARASSARTLNFTKSDEGLKLIKEFYDNARQMSLATRMAMGKARPRKPTLADEQIARSCVKDLVMSGSFSKANLSKHLWLAKHRAVEKVQKESEKPKKAPTPHTIRKQLKLMNIDFDLMISAMQFTRKSYSPSKTSKKKGQMEIDDQKRKKGIGAHTKEQMEKALAVLESAKRAFPISKSVREKVSESGRKIKEMLRRKPDEVSKPSPDKPSQRNIDRAKIQERLKKMDKEEARKRIEKLKKLTGKDADKDDDMSPK